jgi:hypothetical protein
MFGALFRMEFPLSGDGKIHLAPPRTAPKAPDLTQLNQDKHAAD